MGSPIPNTSYRYIQAEETSGDASFSESLLQGLGGDLNYVNGQIVSITNQLNDFYSNGGISAATIFIAEGTGQTFQTSPSGGTIFAAFTSPNFNGTPEAQPICVIPGNQNCYIPIIGEQGGGSIGPLKIQGGTLFVSNFGHEWYGILLYAS